MRTIGIAELKALLSETLARVKGGEEVMITEHGRPIARLLPLSATAPAATAVELVRAGQVKPPEKPLDETFWQLPRGEYRVPPRRRALDDLEDLDPWELREAV
jgi:prevent-host-death family protein